jgi:serine/threonine protein kinase
MFNYTSINKAEYVMVKVIDSELSKKVDENFKNRSTCSALSLEPNINPSTDMWGLGLITLPILFGKVAQNEYNRMSKSRYVKQAKNQTAEERRQHISELFHEFNNTMEVTTGLQYPPEVLRPLIDLESRLLSLDSRQRPTAEETLKILTKLLVSPWPERPSPQVSSSTFTL